ncbi:unnamed protein product [Ilex paraguariensis]|uniref:MHD1 domain-containing protein n=1 Tax=Ilex paraguariensis TaxID=185542 RepID=A0ABC8TU93_9AQUA
MVFAGVEVHSFGDKKKEKNSSFLAGLKNKRDKRHPRSQSPESHSELVDTIRAQMQISEAMDAFVRQRLAEFASRRACGQIDVPQILLGLLNGIVNSNFLNEKSYTQWKKRQANILEESLTCTNCIMDEQQTVGISLAKIRNAEEWDFMMSPSERAEVLLAIRQVALVLSSVPGHFGIPGETYYWSACYHLNIRLYEKLLFSVFDILEEGQLIEEADEIFSIIKLTWSILGITQKLHDALYGWVLFQQFVQTEEAPLLDHATKEVKKVLYAEDTDGNEERYMNSLLCSTSSSGSEMRLDLIQAIFTSMSLWCDSKLQDYHLHFSQKSRFFARVMTMALAVGMYNLGESGEIKLTNSDNLSKIAARKVRTCIERSVEAASRRVADTIDLGSKIDRAHPLALLASELRLIAERELTVFSPVLHHWCPEAGMVSAIWLHRFYGERLEPFLKRVTSLSEDVRLVLHGADALERSLIELYSSTCEENGLDYSFTQEFDHYQISIIARPIILDWVIAQHARILEWTGRAFNLEDWGPLSYQQKQAASAVEVFRIIEETVDQFFGLNLLMDITHLQALLSILFHTLDAYLLNVVSQLVEKHHLYPYAPPLTRYKETTFPIIKKKMVECVPLEEEVNNKLNELTISKLCIRLNTLQTVVEEMAIRWTLFPDCSSQGLFLVSLWC